MIRLDQICRENVKLVNGTEYILIDDFFDPIVFEQEHYKNYLLNFFVLHELEFHKTLSGHPLEDILNEKSLELLDKVNHVWNETCLENRTCVNLTSAPKHLPIHNDSHWATIPIRGILYLNEVCGTLFHSDYMGNNSVELGGKQNQLLLFRVSENSYHSVPQIDTDRFVISMMFDRIKDEKK